MAKADVVNRVEPICQRFDDDGAIPNHPRLPFVIYPGALRFLDREPAALCEEVFASHGWVGAWRDGIFPFAHYHSTAHEVLGIARGRAEVRLGGAHGVVRAVEPGDVVVIPAGGGHQNLGSSDDLLVVGAYPQGQDWDLCYGKPDERPRVLRNIERVPLPSADPVYGADGPLVRHWSKGR